MFRPIQKQVGDTRELLAGADKTISKGDALDFSGGLVQRADSGTLTVRFVAAQDLVTLAGDTDGTPILVYDVRNAEIEADCTSTTDQDQVGLGQPLTDHTHLANNNTEVAGDDVFIITKVVDANKVRGYFLDRIAGTN